VKKGKKRESRTASQVAVDAQKLKDNRGGGFIKKKSWGLKVKRKQPVWAQEGWENRRDWTLMIGGFQAIRTGEAEASLSVGSLIKSCDRESWKQEDLIGCHLYTIKFLCGHSPSVFNAKGVVRKKFRSITRAKNAETE